MYLFVFDPMQLPFSDAGVIFVKEMILLLYVHVHTPCSIRMSFKLYAILFHVWLMYFLFKVPLVLIQRNAYTE